VLAWWALLFVLSIMFISAVTATELALGAAAAMLGAVAAEALRRAEGPRVGGLRAMVAAGAAFPGTLLAETGRLAVAVVRAPRARAETGRTVRLRLEPGTSAAAAAALLSASPGACVLDIRTSQEPDGGAELTLHLLEPSLSAVERALPGRRLT
jgi:hypothetical protein